MTAPGWVCRRCYCVATGRACQRCAEPRQSYRQRLALAVGSLRSRLVFATPERLAADWWRSRMVRAAVYEDNHGAAGTPYRLRLAAYLPCVHG